MTMITPSYLGETIEYSSLHACRSTLEDPTWMTDSPPCLANFHKQPVFTRGTYDYHLATPEELATGWDEVEAEEKAMAKAGAAVKP